MGEERIFGQESLTLREDPWLRARGRITSDDTLARDALAHRVKDKDAVADADSYA